MPTLTYRQPTHPGEVLKLEFLVPLKISQATLASALHIPYQRVNEITNKRRGITPSTALRLSKYFGTTPGFWMNLQLNWDLHHAMKKEEKVLSKLHAFKSQPDCPKM
jgi:addiction module HigA family antidote